MAWHPFNLDHRAHKLVLAARGRNRDSLKQAYKMRATCAYGLERFWGEHLRLIEKEPTKADFVRETWLEFINVMKDSRPDLVIPKKVLSNEDQEGVIRAEAEKFWTLTTTDQQECLAVLVALCDAIVWWTQRLKPTSGTSVADDNRETETTEEARG